jgi:hypothetical protein
MGGFVKLDCGLLHSTVWRDPDARIVFLAALLMAEPDEITQPMAQLPVDGLEPTGWTVPPGFYGFVRASGPGIVDQARLPQEAGMAALRRLGEPDPQSRSQDHEGAGSSGWTGLRRVELRQVSAARLHGRGAAKLIPRA